ncbi:hypothetical protein F53441_9289 [Fusarium austroafricanum]|uniref:Enoyl reductase (ER) domain-containing protein n=1 Tax=Fusarium austroafricanum TaxID=2364996 RepID=A0A8H4KDQ7_9HYPO|nr:hypothetical protein F53441_9289 [Fusarium austroafricanum]
MVSYKVFRGTPEGKIVSDNVERELQNHEVFIETTHSGVCGTDKLYQPSGIVLGHEGIGIIREVGTAVKNVKVGDRVGFGYTHQICGSCDNCCTDLDQYCRERQIYGFSDTDNGSFSYGAVWDSKTVVLIPEGYHSVDAAPLMCAGATVFTVLTKYGLKSEDRVGVMGIGGLGHLGIKIAAAMGAHVVVFSSSESKRQEAMDYGASEFHVFKSGGEAPENMKPVKHLLLCGSANVDYSSLVPIVDTNGVIYPLTAALESTPIPLTHFSLKGIRIQGSLVSSRDNLRKLLEFANRKNIKPTIMKYPLNEEGIENALHDLKDGKTYDPTIEDSYRKKVTVDGLNCMLEILDTAGQEEYTVLRDEWIRTSEAIVIVYSIASRSSFSRVKLFHQQIQRVRSQPTPICLVGNKSDRVTEREVSTTEGFELALSLGIELFVECSAKNAINIEKAFYDLVRSLRAQKSGIEGLYERKQTIFGTQLVIPQRENETSLGRDKLARALVHAARTNNLKDTYELLDAGADINAQPSISGSALHEAASLGYLIMVNALIKQGAGINAKAPSGVPPLQGAAAGGHIDVVKLLIQQGANRDQTSGVRGTALHAAAMRGHAKVVKYLLKQGVNPNEKAGPYEFALHAASWFGAADTVNALLDEGAEIGQLTEEGCTAMHMAAFTGNVQVLQSLINRGGKLHINVISTRFGTALDAADNSGHFAAVELLRQEKAEKSGLQLSKWNNRPNLLSPQETNRQEGSSNSDVNDGQNDEISDDEDDHQQIEEQNLSLNLNNDKPNGTALTSESEYGFFNQPKTSVPPKPPIQNLGFTTLHNPPEARSEVMTWGYDTKVIREFFGGSDSQNISQHGNNLLVRLQQERRNNALAISKNSQHQPQYLPIYSSLLGIVFLATPHNGSGTAGWGLIASNLAKFALQRPSTSVLRGLKPSNELLVNLQRTFLQMLEDGHFTIHSFWETVPMSGIKGLKGLVVPYESATVGHAKKEICLGITATHASICKFSGPSDPGYQAVFGALQDYVRASAHAEVNNSG